MNNITIATLAFAGLLAGMVGCPVLRATVDHPDVGTIGVELDPNATDTEGEPEAMRAVAGPSTNPDDYKTLCSLSGGRHCHGCDNPAGCPQENSGPLCCVGSLCVIWSGSHCSGDLGWCFNYTTSQDPSGITVATCHDEPSE